jgi:phage terminase small subunit
MLTRRRKLFCKHYTDRTNRETYGNGTNSAIKACFSERTAKSIAGELLSLPVIKAEIERLEAENEARFATTKEKAIEESRINYEQAHTDHMKKYWYDKWISLLGWDVTKIENTIEDKREERVQSYREEVNRLLQRN